MIGGGFVQHVLFFALSWAANIVVALGQSKNPRIGQSLRQAFVHHDDRKVGADGSGATLMTQVIATTAYLYMSVLRMGAVRQRVRTT
jgi:hypothetical protein